MPREEALLLETRQAGIDTIRDKARSLRNTFESVKQKRPAHRGQQLEECTMYLTIIGNTLRETPDLLPFDMRLSPENDLDVIHRFIKKKIDVFNGCIFRGAEENARILQNPAKPIQDFLEFSCNKIFKFTSILEMFENRHWSFGFRQREGDLLNFYNQSQKFALISLLEADLGYERHLNYQDVVNRLFDGNLPLIDRKKTLLEKLSGCGPCDQADSIQSEILLARRLSSKFILEALEIFAYPDMYGPSKVWKYLSKSPTRLNNLRCFLEYFQTRFPGVEREDRYGPTIDRILHSLTASGA